MLDTAAEGSFKSSMAYLSSGAGSAGGGRSTFFSAFSVASSSASSSPPLTGQGRFGNFAAPVRDFFSSVGNRARGFTPLGSDGGDEPGFFGSLSWGQRMLGFAICSAGAVLFFAISFFTLPLFPISPHKFAVTFTMGSIMALSAFALLRGPMAQMRHLFSRERLPFTVAYFGSMLLTLISSLVYRSYLVTLGSAVVQLAAVVWYFVSYLPGGTSGLRMGSRAVARSVLPI